MTPSERVAAITCICGDAPVVLTIIDHRLGARADYCADCEPKHKATIERLRGLLASILYILYHDERGQGVGYAEAMEQARAHLAKETPHDPQ